MSLKAKLLGPKSKYDKLIPYTYEARYAIIDGEKDYNSYFSDTVCGLIYYLIRKGLTPEQVSMFEIYHDRECEIDPARYMQEDKSWRIQKQLCQSFKSLYPEHICETGCSFEDRARYGIG